MTERRGTMFLKRLCQKNLTDPALKVSDYRKYIPTQNYAACHKKQAVMRSSNVPAHYRLI